MDNSLAIPTIGTRGKFGFRDPFNKVMKEDQEYTVMSIRSIKDMIDSGDLLYEHVYMEVGLTDADYDNDVTNNVPIIVFTDISNKYYYVPATYLTSQVDKTGTQYQEVMLAVNIGYLPLAYDLAGVKALILDSIKAATGIQSTVEEVKTSNIIYIDDDIHKEYMRRISAVRDPISMEPVDVTDFKTRYIKLLNLYNLRAQKMELLERAAKKYIVADTTPQPQIP